MKPLRFGLLAQLLTGFAAVGGLVVLLLFAGNRMLEKSSALLVTTVEQHVRPLARLHTLQSRFGALRTQELELGHLEDVFALQSQVARLRSEIADMDVEIDKFSDLLGKAAPAEAAQLAGHWRDYRSRLNEQVRLAAKMDLAGVRAITVAGSNIPFLSIQTGLAEVAERTETAAAEAYQATIAEQAKQRPHFLWLVTFSGLLIFIGLAYSGRTVVHRVSILREHAQKLAAGEESGQIELARYDEIGDLAQVFEIMRHQVLNREAALRGAQAALELRVEERTADLRRANRRLVRFSQVVEQNPVGILVARIGGAVEFANPAYLRITGRTAAELIGRPLLEVLHTADPLDAENAVRVALGSTVWQVEQPSRRGDDAYWERLRLGVVRNELDQMTHLLLSREDITEQREQMEKITYQAHYDILTGLPNRVLANDRLVQAVSRARRDGGKAVAWIVFGVWATGLVRRIQALGRAHREFSDAGEASPLVLASLEAAEPRRGDELGELSGTLLGMMGSITEHRRAQEKAAEILRLSEARFRFLIEGTQVVTWEYSTQTESFTYVSPQAVGLLGYPLAEWLQPNFLQAYAHPDDLPRVRKSRIQAVEEGIACALDYRLRHRDGHFVWVHHLSGAMAADDLAPREMVRGMLLDISERKRIEQHLALAGQVFETASEGIMLTDAQNRIVSVNPAFEAITCYPAAEVMGKDPKLLNAGLQGQDYYKAMWHGLQRDGRWEGEVWNRRKSGEPFAQRLSVSIIRDEWGHIKNHLAMFSDITTQKRQAEEIKHQADHDALTGLPNRRLLADRMTQAIARAQRHSGQVGMMMLDLDGFKHINDTLGHRIGDLLLIETAHRLVHCVRESDTVARIGGDEFMVVLPEIQSQNDLQTLATKILEHLRQRFHIEGKDMYVSGSLGLALFPDDGTDAETLLANADTAMYRAKAEGKNAYRFFTQDMQKHALERLQIENGLRRALREGEFVLRYQPVFELVTGALAKAEVLIRWRDPERGLVEPVDFIPVAEETGLIVPVGAWVIQAVARQAAQWKHAVPPGFRLGINLSAQQFQRGDCAHLLRDTLRVEGADPRQLVVEITESVFISDKGDARRQIQEMKGFGIQVAIDDFGTGFSSLSYLKHFPVDTLKIDQSFVSGIPEDAEDVALIEAIISMSRALNLDVVAEGIETEAQHRFLIDSGCRYGQGYLLGKPVAAEEFEKLFLPQPVPVTG